MADFIHGLVIRGAIRIRGGKRSSWVSPNRRRERTTTAEYNVATTTLYDPDASDRPNTRAGASRLNVRAMHIVYRSEYVNVRPRIIPRGLAID